MAENTLSYYWKNFYAQGGHTTDTYYFYIVRPRDQTFYNTSTKALSATTTRVNMAIAMTEVNGQGAYPILVPSTLTEGEVYDIVICRQSGVAPAVGDSVEKVDTLKHGGIFGF